MAFLDAVQNQVFSAVRLRGADYHRRGRVNILNGSANELRATVKGTRSYGITILRNQERLLVVCDCPALADSASICKHVWATLLAAAKEGHLGAFNPPPPSRIAIAGWTGLGSEKRPPQASKPGPKSDATRTSNAPAPSWRRALDLVHASAQQSAGPGAAQSAQVSAWPSSRTIFYILDVEASTTAGSGLALDLASRDRSSSGTQGRLKPLRIMHQAIDSLTDPADRDLIRMLAGPTRIEPRAARPEFRPPITGPVQIPPALTEVTFRAACATGRCLLKPRGHDPLPEPLVWDDGPPWRIRIDVTRTEDGGHRLTGAVVRGEERRALTDFLLFSTTGTVISRKAVARLQIDGAFDWMRALMSFGELEVPESATSDLLDALAACPGGALGELPDDLRIEELRVTPRPRLVVRKPDRPSYWGPQRLEARLSFLYENSEVVAASATPTVRAPGERTVYRRELSVEAAAGARLAELGLRADDARKPEELVMTPAQLPVIASTLTGEGWQIEADGKLYRVAGSFRLAVSTGIDWFELGGEAHFDGVTIEIPRLLAAIKRGERTVTLGDGTIGVLPESWLKKYGMLADLGDSKGERVRYRRGQAGLLDALLVSLDEVACDESFTQLRRELNSFHGVEAVTPGTEFRGELREYQREGLGWLRFLERFGFGGCLADDMGLGKTVQVLAHLATRSSGGPTLVVAPRSLVFHWRDEAARFAPALKVLDHATPDRRTDPAFIAKHDLVLTTYGTVRRDILLLKEIPFDYAILDEAQVVKNAVTETFKSVRLLQARHRLALSGTPVENHLGELWSLFEFLNPGMLGSAAIFKRATSELRDPDADIRGVLRRALKPFLLRRTKEAVAKDLPDRLEETIMCELSHGQRRLYDELRNHYRASLLGKMSADGIKQAKFQVLEALLRLRQAACHPGLVNPALASASSAKLDELLPQLEEVIDGGHKALVFSQFTSFLSLLRQRLDPKGVVYEYLDGKTRDRAARVKRFQTDPNCSLFLISLKAGGLGLNLTAAEYVFLLDPWWNPASEAQAIDRAHRIGQTRNVFAYRLIAADTIEERVLELQKTKRALADAILGADKGLVASLTREDLELLLK